MFFCLFVVVVVVVVVIVCFDIWSLSLKAWPFVVEGMAVPIGCQYLKLGHS